MVEMTWSDDDYTTSRGTSLFWWELHVGMDAWVFLFGNATVPHLRVLSAAAAKKGHFRPLPPYTPRMSASASHRFRLSQTDYLGLPLILLLSANRKGQTKRTDLEVSNGVLLHHPQMPARPPGL